MDGGDMREFLVHARLDMVTVETWVAAGWLAPLQGRRQFSAVDRARAEFIRDLKEMGVNDEAVPVILDLVDQLHGVRRRLREVLAACTAPDQGSDRDAPQRDA